eukprot:6181243-Pleurochrysis_carterae.AAC.5
MLRVARASLRARGVAQIEPRSLGSITRSLFCAPALCAFDVAIVRAAGAVRSTSPLRLACAGSAAASASARRLLSCWTTH